MIRKSDIFILTAVFISFLFSVILWFTGQKDAEEALRTSQERFRLLFEGAPLAIGAIDRNLRFIQVNPAFCNLLGYAEDEMLGMSLAEISAGEAGAGAAGAA